MFDDTITGEWWKTSRVQSSQTRIEPENGSDEETAMISVLKSLNPEAIEKLKTVPIGPTGKRHLKMKLNLFKKTMSGKW